MRRGEDLFRDELVVLPPLVFAEMARNLDPVLVHNSVDPRAVYLFRRLCWGMPLPMALSTDLGSVRLFVHLLGCVPCPEANPVGHSYSTGSLPGLFRLAGAATQPSYAHQICVCYPNMAESSASRKTR